MNEAQVRDAILERLHELRAKVATIEAEVQGSAFSPTAMSKARQLCPDMVELAVTISNKIDEEI